MTIAARAIFVLALSLAAHAVPPPMDSSFGTNGVVSYPIEGIAPASLAVLSDGRILTSIQRTAYSSTAYSGTLPPPRVSLFRFLPDGSLDTHFGVGGMIEIASQFGWLDYMPSFPIAELPGGGFVLAGRSVDGLAHQKYRDDGTADGPIVVESFEPQLGCTDTQPNVRGIRVQPDGKLVILGELVRLSDFSSGPVVEDCLAVVRYLPQGGLDTVFGSQGKLLVPSFGSSDLVIEPGGKLVFGSLTGFGSNTTLNFLTLNPDGSRDTAAGAAGIRKVPVSGSPGLGCSIFPLAEFAPDGIIVSYECGTYSEIWRFTARGDIVASFGNGGSLKLALATEVFARRGQMFLQRDGAVVIVGSVRDNSGYTEIVIERLRPDGSADPAFGAARMFTVNRPNSIAVQGLMQPDGNLLLTSHNKDGIVNDTSTPSNLALMRVRTAPPLVEFHNTILDHYFVSLENDEAHGIDNGAAGPGWQRTGQSFPSGGAAATCRFYGTRGIGPNSHFYTAEPSECEGVKRDPGWTYEGIGFYASRVVASGCPSNQVPVHRLYNNRARQNDSNHRFVVDTALIPAMTAAGWIHEGVVFCVPR